MEKKVVKRTTPTQTNKTYLTLEEEIKETYKLIKKEVDDIGFIIMELEVEKEKSKPDEKEYGEEVIGTQSINIEKKTGADEITSINEEVDVKEKKVVEKLKLYFINPVEGIEEFVVPKIYTYTNVESNVCEESILKRNKRKLKEQVAKPLVKENEIEKRAREALKANEKFGKRPYEKLVKSVDDLVDVSPNNIEKAEEEKKKLIEEMKKEKEVIEKVMNEVKKAEDIKALEKAIRKLPPRLAVKYEYALLKGVKRIHIEKMLAYDLLFINKAINGLKIMGINEIKRTATSMVIRRINEIIKSIFKK